MRTLFDVVADGGPLEVRDAIGWTLRASMTMWALHEEGVVHGRISPEAILVGGRDCRTDGILKKPSQVQGDENYHSLDRGADGPSSRQDDVWGLAITLYFVLTGTLPYPRGVYRALRDGKLREPPPIAVHGAALDVMQPVMDRLIRADRRDRLKAAEEIVAGLRDLSPAIADVTPLAIERPFIDDPPPEEEEEAPRSSRDEQAWKELVNEGSGPAPAPEAEASWRNVAIAFVSALVVGVVVFMATSSSDGETSVAPSPTPPSTSRPAEGSTTPTPPPAVPEVSVAASSAPAPTPVAPPVRRSPGGDFGTCTSSLFASDAFAVNEVTSPFPCEQANPAAGVQTMTTLLANGSGGLSSEATREWSRLGWYRAAAFAVARTECCSEPVPLRAPRLIEVCNLDAILNEVALSVQRGTDDQVASAIKRFGVAASCVGAAGSGTMFNVEGLPNTSQAAAFLRMVGRLRVANFKK